LARVTTRAYGSLAPAICDTRVVLYFPHAMHRLLEITAKCFSAQVILAFSSGQQLQSPL
jgi:hypothetical protein